ncbi:MAG TPA: DNA recombination protein RmuC [Burkholderiales bacterium]|nr:DNA recombination protein RmuC [Burkholderiales bacterium]
MMEVLLVLTLIASAATAGLIALLVLKERASAREGREELGRGLNAFSQTLASQMTSIATVQNSQIEHIRRSLEESLARLQQDNAAKLEQMRLTVDEKLHATLEKRLSESFKQVSERLELVHKGLGEMQSLAAGVGDLKKVLSNVKTRGVFGEVQLAALLEQVMAPEQYERNAATRPNSRERVEFAIKLPGRESGEPVLLPIDAKFPLEDYQRLQAAEEAGDLTAIDTAGKALEARVKLEAKSIAEKYVEPPYTTDFALLYLPFEGLFGEVLRRPGLFEQIQRQWRVTICGPTNLLAYLNSLQMGFRTLAIQQRSSEVWKVLGTVKAEFGKFAEVLANTKRQLQTVANSIDQAETRTRQIERKLRDVETLESKGEELLAAPEESPPVQMPLR